MAGTSLSLQLKRLATPQTSNLVEKKKRASFLFDPNEAANIDRNTFYEIGINGLEHLIAINDKFSEFKHSLFDAVSKNFERDVENVTTNENLNKCIKRFLFLLSPYFLLKHSQKALEWLIVRFRINEHNVDDLLCLAFPYHGTRLFARLIQVFNFKDPQNRWHWLVPVQRKGVPLSKTALFNRCADDPSFLKLICSMTVDATRVYADDSFKLATLFSFYCTTLIGGIEHMKKVNDIHLTHMLPSLLYGLSENCLDLNASVLIILGVLSTKTSFETSLLHKLVYKIVKIKDKTLLKESVILLNVLYQRENISETSISQKTIKHIAEDPVSFIDVLGELISSMKLTNTFYMVLVRDSLKLAQQLDDDCGENVRNFAEMLLREVRVDNYFAEHLIRMLVDTGDSNSEPWYCQLIQNMENQYPDPCDNVISSVIQEGNKESINHLLGLTSVASQIQGFLKLNSPNVAVRVEMIKYIAEYSNSFNWKYLETSVNARWDDEEPEVLLAMYGLPDNIQCYNTNVFKSLLSKCWRQSSSEWQFVLVCTIKKLPVLDIINNHELCVALLLPFFITSSNDIKSIILEISQEIPLFKKLSEKTRKNVFKAITKVLEDNSVSFDVGQLLCSFQELNHDIVYTFTLLFLLSTKFSSVDDDDRLQILTFLFEEIFPKYRKKLRKRTIHTWDKDCFLDFFEKTKTGHLPIEMILYSVESIIRCSSMSVKQMKIASGWLNLTEEAWNICVRLYYYLIINCPSIPEDNDNSCLSSFVYLFLEEHFDTLTQRVNFICNFKTYYFHDKIMRLFGSKLIHQLLTDSSESYSWALNLETDNVVVVTCLTDAYSDDHELRAVSIRIFRLLANCIGSALSTVPSYFNFVKYILDAKEEILMDYEVLPTVSAAFLSQNDQIQNNLHSSVRVSTLFVLEQLLGVIMNQRTPSCVSECLLDILKYVEDDEIVLTLIPYITNLLSDETVQCDERFYSSVVTKVFDRLNKDNIKTVCKKTPFTRLFDKCLDLRSSKSDGKRNLIEYLMFKLSNDDLFDIVDVECRAYVLNKIIDFIIERRLDSDFLSAAGRFVKKISLPAKLVIPYLNSMKEIAVLSSKSEPDVKINTDCSRENHNFDDNDDDNDDDIENENKITSSVSETAEWRKGLKMMEYIQNKKKIKHSEIVIPILFQVLQKCIELDGKISTEYSKQVCLSCISNYTEKLDETVLNEETTERLFNIELIVKCVRVSPNPQTHHHALILLSQCAIFAPQQVLRNVMSIFTFMGSSVLRQDDVFSFQIIVHIMDTLIPLLLVKRPKDEMLSSSSTSENKKMVVSCLKVFADSALDIPEHRRIPLLEKLIQIVGEEDFLWMFIALLFECEVSGKRMKKLKKASKTKLAVKKSIDKQLTDDLADNFQHQLMKTNDFRSDREGKQTADSDRVLISQQLCCKFDVSVIIKCCAQLIECANKLPHEKGDKFDSKWHSENNLFSIKCYSSYQLRYLKYSLISFCLSALSSNEFICKLTIKSSDELRLLTIHFEEVIEQSLIYARRLTKYMKRCKRETSKFWKILLSRSLDILNKVNALLPSDAFLNVLERLLDHDILLIQTKMMELLCWRLNLRDGNPSAITCSSSLVRITKPLLSIMKKKLNCIDQQNVNDLDVHDNCVASINSLQFITKHCNVLEHVNTFKEILNTLCDCDLLNKVEIPYILSHMVFCISQLFSSLNVHAIESLPVFMRFLIKTIRKSNCYLSDEESPLLISAVGAIDNVMKLFLKFMSPYLKDILYQLSILFAQFYLHYSKMDYDFNILLLPKLKGIRLRLSSNELDDRVLLPAIKDCLIKLYRMQHYDAIKYLMEMLSHSVKVKSAFPPELTSIFLSGLAFRCVAVDGTDEDDIDKVETYVIDGLCDIALKYSETSFRQFYKKLYDWAVTDVKYDGAKDRIITYYRVLHKLSNTFKSLFPLFATNFIRNAAELLDKNNISKYEKCSDMYYGDNLNKSVLLVDEILATLCNVFKFDLAKFTNKERFNILCEPLVNQIENTIGDYEKRATNITDCLAHFAAAAKNDSRWKHFIYLVLMKTRHALPEVRLTALETVCKFATLLGDNFLPFLPETVPFLAELLEDENETVEKKTKAAIQKLEAAIGEPIQKYF